MKKKRIYTEEQKEQKRIYMAEYRLKNKAKNKIYKKEWLKKNPLTDEQKAKKKITNANWYQENKEQQKISTAKYYQDNKEEKKRLSKEWQKKNPGYSKAYSKKWHEANPGYSKEHNHKHDLGYWIVYIITNYNGLGDDYCGQSQNVYNRMKRHKSLGRLNTDTYTIVKKCDTLEDALELESAVHNFGYHGARTESGK